MGRLLMEAVFETGVREHSFFECYRAGVGGGENVFICLCSLDLDEMWVTLSREKFEMSGFCEGRKNCLYEKHV
jgi:hypothetical protein